MLVTTEFLNETIRDFVRTAALPIGLHLSLTLGKAVAPIRDVPDLVDREGNLSLSASQLLLNSFASSRCASLLNQIGRELEAQLACAHDSGLRATHVDSHQHVHMNPAIFAVLQNLLPRFGIDRIRFSREPFMWSALGKDLPAVLWRLNPAKWAILRWRAASIRPRAVVNDDFFGVMYSGAVNKSALTRLIANVPKTRAVEICMHPGFPAPQGTEIYPKAEYNTFISSPARTVEHDILLDTDVASLLRRRGLTLRAYDGAPKFERHT
jgi:predicted glycoside hydrolase/deacetylase ChbG (UPF0249 family)